MNTLLLLLALGFSSRTTSAGEIHGTVFCLNAGIPGVTVSVRAEAGAAIATAVSREDGAYRVVFAKGKARMLRFELAGANPLDVPICEDRTRQIDASLVINRSDGYTAWGGKPPPRGVAEGAYVKVRILDSRSKPVRGAEVDVSWKFEGQIYHERAVSDRHGEVPVPQTPDHASFDVSARGFASRHVLSGTAAAGRIYLYENRKNPCP